MTVGLLIIVIVAAGLVVLSGVWVAAALIAAVWHGERRGEGVPARDSDKDTG